MAWSATTGCSGALGAGRSLFLAFAPAVARLGALAVTGRIAIAPLLLRLSTLGLLRLLPVALTFTRALARLAALLVTLAAAIALVAAPVAATTRLAHGFGAHR
jgi:hypothetical protein